MKRRWKIRNPQFRAFLYLLPALSVIAVFQFYPVLKSFFMGFYTKFDYLTDTCLLYTSKRWQREI